MLFLMSLGSIDRAETPSYNEERHKAAELTRRRGDEKQLPVSSAIRRERESAGAAGGATPFAPRTGTLREKLLFKRRTVCYNNFRVTSRRKKR